MLKKKKDEYKFEQVLNRTIIEIKHKPVWWEETKGTGVFYAEIWSQGRKTIACSKCIGSKRFVKSM